MHPILQFIIFMGMEAMLAYTMTHSPKTMSQQEKIIEAFERFVGVNILYQTVNGDLFVDLADAQASATSQLSNNIITINRPANLPVEVLPFEGKWVYMPFGLNETAVPGNLIANGFGELGGKVNFSKFEPFIFNEFAEFGTRGVSAEGLQSFLINSKALVTTDALIPVSYKEMYVLEFLATTNLSMGEDATECGFEVGLQLFDEDGEPIKFGNVNVNPLGNGAIRLRSPLMPGDTFLDLTGIPTVSVANNERNIAFLRHTFKNGKTVMSYSRSIIENAYASTGYLDTNGGMKKLILQNPYTGDPIETGTRIGNPANMNLALYKIGTISRTQIQNTVNDTYAYRWVFGGQEASHFDDSVRFNRFVKYVKFFVRQVTLENFDLVLSDISLRVGSRKEDVTPKLASDRISTPSIPAFDFYTYPDGCTYNANGTLYEMLNGAWATRPFTELND
jgi:hypothetical protein